MSINLLKRNIDEVSHSRKKTLGEVIEGFRHDEKYVYLESMEDLNKLAEILNVKPSVLFDSDEIDDINEGVKILYNNEGYSRTSKRKGKDYYTYKHLVTTNTDPGLMPLRVTLHCRDDEDVTLNAGHDSKEVIYITKGKIKMDWESNNQRYSKVLTVGDSAYIHPGVPHSFMALDNDAELLAFNY